MTWGPPPPTAQLACYGRLSRDALRAKALDGLAPPRTPSGKPVDLPEQTDGRFREYSLPCLQRPVGSAAVLDTQDDDFAAIFPDAVKDPISTPTRRPYPGQVIEIVKCP